MTEETTSPSNNFIRNRVRKDIEEKSMSIMTRFPPEPNGYLHIGHAKSICLNFGIAQEFNGQCNLRFDDTNPDKENEEYVESIKRDVEWLGYRWSNLLFTSDYYEQLFQFAIKLIEMGKAYVCHLDAEQVRVYRGTLTEPGKDSPHRDRSVEENLDLFNRMRQGELKEGECVLRAKIDMASPNINMRDPALYRIKHAHHHRTANEWCIYPMYDYAHCVSDAIENITHSLCTLEFEDHRPLYDWILDTLNTSSHPQQIEFARLSLDYTVTSKRKLHQLVDENHVDGWDDPRMPTITGLRRRGYPAAAIRDFCERIGITKKDSQIDVGVLENCVREDLDYNAPRAMCVLKPLKVIIENYPEDQTEQLDASNHPKRKELGKRSIPFSREFYIEQDDFMEDPPKKFFRLGPGREVRLRYAYYVTCTDVIKDDDGKVIELRCTYDPETRGGKSADGRKIKGTIHWVSVAHALPVQVNSYDRLFNTPNPGAEENMLDSLNPGSLEVLDHCFAEPYMADAEAEQNFQFERTGYYTRDKVDSKDGKAVFNRTVTLRDTWAKVSK
ncbi:MAG: glutamine--tRNA ligase/YqeY domain fusion protein [Gammaproteobacteria bacterium]